MKKRYLALQIESSERFNLKDFLDALWNSILKLYGEYGASRIALTLIQYNYEKQLAVIRVSHAAVKMVRASLSTITRIGINQASIHVLTVSGTIKALHSRLKQI